MHCLWPSCSPCITKGTTHIKFNYFWMYFYLLNHYLPAGDFILMFSSQVHRFLEEKTWGIDYNSSNLKRSNFIRCTEPVMTSRFLYICTCVYLHSLFNGKPWLNLTHSNIEKINGVAYKFDFKVKIENSVKEWFINQP